MMLAVTSYKADTIANCRTAIEAQLKAFRALPKGPERDAFAPLFFRHMVLALDHYFLHRLRAAEGKDGGPLNELRMLCNAIHDAGGVLTKDAQIKYDAAKSVSGIAIGAPVVLDEKTFVELAGAFIDEIGRKYP